MEIVIALIMYLGNPPELKEHLLMPDYKTCLQKKRHSIRNSNAEYRCIKTNAELETNIDGSISIKKLILE